MGTIVSPNEILLILGFHVYLWRVVWAFCGSSSGSQHASPKSSGDNISQSFRALGSGSVVGFGVQHLCSTLGAQVGSVLDTLGHNVGTIAHWSLYWGSPFVEPPLHVYYFLT